MHSKDYALHTTYGVWPLWFILIKLRFHFWNMAVFTYTLFRQGWDDPYIPRTHEGLLKWKYPEMNSVDFLFEVGLLATLC